jgi:crossover junction endodeoxyribonuclease RusA
MTFDFPYPPSVNAYWLQSGKRRYISKRGVEFKKNVHEILRKNHATFGDKPVEVSIILFPRDKRLLDIDNCCKAILDSMNGVLFDDDQQVWKLTVERGEKIKGGGCRVSVCLYDKKNSGGKITTQG